MTQVRDFKTKRLLQGIGSRDVKRQSMYDIQANLRSSVGILRMNREHRFNALTPGFAAQVSRGIETMNLDHTVKLIYLTTAEGKHFSNGTDFRTLLHLQKDGKDEKLASYIEDLYKLQTTFAKINKPIMSVAPGHSYNSGAGLLVASGLPSICHDSKIAFNEVTFGYVPHAGSTYYASRLPGDFGTFLLLTGWPLTGKDAIKLGMADCLIEIPETYEHEVCDTVLAMDPISMPSSRQVLGKDNFGIDLPKPAESQAYQRSMQRRQQQKDDTSELRMRMKTNIHDEPFIDPNDRKPDIVAYADLGYKKMLKKWNNDNYGDLPDGGKGFYEHGAESYNQFGYIHNYLTMHSGHIWANNSIQTLLQHREMIDRCFWYNSIEEIQDALKRETHPFAKEILQKMDCNSMLSMKLALKMLRKSKNLAYGEILKMELNVALNKVEDSDFELGVKEVLMKPTKVSRLGMRPNPGFKTLVSDSEVDSFFSENKHASKIDLDIVENSLLPTRHFFTRFSDSMRVYINETSSPQEEIREAVKIEIEQGLRAEGIDIRDKTVTVPMAREYIDRKLKRENMHNELMRRSTQMVTDKKLRHWYFDGINQELLKMEDKKGFYSIVNEKIHQIFENAYFERLNLIYEKSKEAQSLEKRRMFIKMKKFLIKSRIMGYMSEESDRLVQQVKALPFKMIHLTEKWDQSYRDIEHPDLQKSVMWHLSKVVGKANLAPLEMAKTYMTNPEAAKQMQAYTFDKVELQKLQADLLENPEKYQEMLRKDIDCDDPWLAGNDFGRFFEKKWKMEEKQQYWYMIDNDGRLNPEENWPMRVEYFKYKQWRDEIKNKSLDTLKYTVSRLLVDFETDKIVGNKTVHFQEKENDTKKRTLERLLTQLNERTEANPIIKKASTPEQFALKHDQRSFDQIEIDLNQMINDDKDLSKLFGKSLKKEQNPRIHKFRNEMLRELLQLVEVSLLEDVDISQYEDEYYLEKRLAELMNPANMDEDYSASLNMIDSYLSDKHGKQILKATVQSIKPFFLQVYQEKLDEEIKSILDEFKFQDNSIDALEMYLAFQKNPTAFKNSKALKKMQNFSEELIARETFEAHEPLNGKRFAMRNILSQFGIGKSFTDAKSPKDLTEAARVEQQDYSEYNRIQGLVESEINEEIDHQKAMLLKNSYDEDSNDLIDNHTWYKSLTQEELDDMENLAYKLEEAERFVDDHKHEIDTLMQPSEWLDVYSKSILDFDISMDHFIHSTSDKFRDNKENWTELAEYAKYIRNIDNEKIHTKPEDYDKVIEFLATREKKDHENEIQRESIFQGFVQKQYDSESETKDTTLKNKVLNMQSLQETIKRNADASMECLRLANFAPKDIKDQVVSMIQSKSKYLDFEILADYLAKRDFSERFDAARFIEQTALFKDVHGGNALERFYKQYRDTKLDVVSLAEIKAVVDETAQGELDSQKDIDIINQIETVLQHVEQQMSYVSNERRSQITLGEFLSKHHYMNQKSFRHYSSDLLKSQIESAIGQKESPEDAHASIDYELGGIISQTVNPNTDMDKTLRDVAYGQESKQGSFQLRDNATGLTSTESDTLKIVYQAARKATALTPEMDYLKNLYENKLLREYTKEKYDPKVIEGLVQDYMTARIKDCSIKLDFSEALSSDHAHIYMKTLRERIMDELKLDEGTSIEEFDYMCLYDSVPAKSHDPESKYNLGHLNNDQAIGYRNLEERAKDVSKNAELAHESVFDEMLADYFLQKRGDFKKGNKLMSDLEKQFDAKTEYSHPHGNGQDTLGYHYLAQSVDKDESPELIPHNFPALLELDIAVNRNLHNGRGGISHDLRDMGDEKFLIPDYFETHDVRKPADLYVKDKLQYILDDLFASRRKLEKHLSRGELVAYDKVLSKYLTQENLLGKLKREIYKDYNELEQLNQMASHEKDSMRSEEKQRLKVRNTQPEFNKGVINEDAFYKQLAYSGLIEKKRRDNRKNVIEDHALAAGFHSFENYYQDKLVEDAKLPARQIDPSVFNPKKQTKITGTSDRKDYGYLDNVGKRDLFLEEHAQYKENKLEQTQRIETFYVLEQFFEQQRSNPVQDNSNPLYKAQEHIREYFSEPENTHFFDKNRIH